MANLFTIQETLDIAKKAREQEIAVRNRLVDSIVGRCNAAIRKAAESQQKRCDAELSFCTGDMPYAVSAMYFVREELANLGYKANCIEPGSEECGDSRGVIQISWEDA